ncbi:MAG: hypothetical protein IPI60_02255 [Saprospiraceae bacterium]|nr:hypothetical protein [Saprospiraceae bacterium]
MDTSLKAVIDLGTNTFHLLIGKVRVDGTIEEVYRKRIYVRLAEEGISVIADAPYQRGLLALEKFRTVLSTLGDIHVIALGTAALRTAKNGSQFIEEVKSKYDIDIQLIDGMMEANLIYEGVRHGVDLGSENSLIMDIGGGSVEFIIANQDGKLWSRSFPCGVAVLYRKFHKTDPIKPAAIDEMNTWLDDLCMDLLKAIEVNQPKSLAGASGSFEVLAASESEELLSPTEVSSDFFFQRYHEIKYLPLFEIEQIAWIPNERKKLIVVSFALIDWIISKLHSEKIVISPYALKEGIFFTDLY